MPNFLLFIIVPSPEQIKVDGFEYACGPDVRGYGIGLGPDFMKGVCGPCVQMGRFRLLAVVYRCKRRCSRDKRAACRYTSFGLKRSAYNEPTTTAHARGTLPDAVRASGGAEGGV